MSHWPIAPERNSEQLRQKLGASGTEVSSDSSSSRTIESHSVRKYRSRSGFVNLIPYPVGSVDGTLLCHAVACIVATLPPTPQRRRWHNLEQGSIQVKRRTSRATAL